jgi:DNA-binding NtrC family response regulator
MNTKPHVLLIDDETEILELLDLMLSRAGFKVTLAESGEQALKALALTDTSFDMVVCDYLMPKMNGIDLLKIVRGKKDYTPFIFFSGNADDSHGLEVIGLGAYEIVPKTEITNLVKILNKRMKQDAILSSIDGARAVSEESDDFLKLLYSTGT